MKQTFKRNKLFAIIMQLDIKHHSSYLNSDMLYMHALTLTCALTTEA